MAAPKAAVPRPVAGPAPLPPPQKPEAAALGLFERGIRALQRHEFADAARAFGSLLQSHPAERALLERTRVYLDLCERELRRRPAAPQSVEERLTAATLALNSRDDAQAERLAKSVISENADHDLAFYILGAIEARRGRVDRALAHLQDAVRVNPDVRVQVRADEDFHGLRENETFRALVETPTAAGTRRLRRPRADR